MSGRTRLGLALALGGLTVVLDTTITVVAVPVLAEAFDAPLGTLQWTTTAYLLAFVTTLPLAAWLSSRFGARRSYVAALLVFAVGSAAAGAALGPLTLIAARVLQGLGGGLVNPLGITIAMRGLAANRRGRMASLLGLPVLVGPLCGPILAGALIDSVSWRAIFLVTVPPALLGAWLVHRWAPADPPGARIRLDLAGLLRLVPGAVAIVYGVSDAGAPTPVRLAAAGCGSVLLTAFVRRSLHHPAPLLRVRLLADPVFAAGLAVLVLFGAAYFGSMLLNPIYVQVTRGDSALLAGSLGIPAGLATGLSLQVATRLVDRIEPRRIVGTGLLIALVALSTSVAVLRTDTSYVVVAGLAGLLGLGSGAVLMPTMTAATRHLDGPDLASGASVMGLAQQLATVFGTAGIAALFAALAPLDSPPAELVTAHRLSLLVPLTLVAGALAVALTRLETTPRKERSDDRTSGRTVLVERR